MKHVKQQDVSGCGIACVAMMAGEHVTYQMVRDVWMNNLNGKEERITRGDGLRIFEVQDLAHMFGVKSFPYVAPTIIQIDSKSGRGGHYVVLTKEGTILDPSA
jgi:ABC-type bacteriocin/lantibiotic exporter with double-glycine peptidase domain